MSQISAMDLTELEPVMAQAENVCRARHVSFEDFLRLFDESVHGRIRAFATQPGFTHVVCCENLDAWSSRFGDRTCLGVGAKPEGAEVPSWSLEFVLTKEHFRLGDVPSRFMYPVAYADLSSVRQALAQQQVDARPSAS